MNEAMAAQLPVLVSSRCGCSGDLVEPGHNGFVFDPHDSEELTQLLGRMERMPKVEREGMGRRSGEIISRFTPEAFGQSIEKILFAGERKLAGDLWEVVS